MKIFSNLPSAGCTLPPSLQKAALSLRVAGVAGSQHARDALMHLAKLTSRISSLAKLFPRLSTTCELLVVAGSLNMSRPENRTFTLDNQRAVSNSGAANLVEWLLLNVGEVNSEKEKDLWFDILAIRWLYSAVLRCFGDQIPYYRLSLDSPSEDYKKITSNKEKRSALSIGASEAGYKHWLDQVSKHAPESGLLRAVYDLERVTEINFSRAHHYHPRPPPRLNERHLLKNHWHFPSPYEQEQLVKLFSKELATELPNFYEVGIEISKKKPDGDIEEQIYRQLQTYNRYEVALIALSVQTCRSITSILSWRVYVDSSATSTEDRIQIVKNSSSYGNLKIVWIKGRSNTDVQAKIDLPYYVQQWIKSIHPGIGAPTIDELLPYSVEPWDTRAYEYLSKELGCTPQRAEIICRDFVPRLIYQGTANAALVNFWRSDSRNPASKPERLALGHYLQPHGNRTCTSFAEACRQALGSSIYRNKEPVNITGDKYALPVM